MTQQWRVDKWVESYPEGWEQASFGTKVASTQFSIAAELLLLVKQLVVQLLSPHSFALKWVKVLRKKKKTLLLKLQHKWHNP